MKTVSRLGRTLKAPLLPMVFLMLAVQARAAPAADDIAGEWEVKMDRNGRESFASLSIAKKADGALSGKWGSAELADVKFDGQKLTFTRTVRFGDQEFKLDYEGTFKDGAFTGTLSSERGSFTANAARPKPRNPLLGRWELKYMIGDRQIDGTLTVAEGTGGALDAKWMTTTGEHVVSNVKFQDGKLTLARKSKIGDREFESTYEATLKGHKLEGTIHGSMGDIPANGNRVGADLIGKWELTTTTERGTRMSALIIFGDLSGRFEFFGGEIPFKNLKLEGGQITFSVEAGFGDQPATMEFKGKLEGQSLKGELTTPRGTREVTGKKLDPEATGKKASTSL